VIELKEVRDDIREIKDVLIRNTVSLEEHMKRSELSEQRIDRLEKYHLGFLTTAVALLLGILAKLLIK
jgi:hypothetical protein